jgi:hypothetical protein
MTALVPVEQRAITNLLMACELAFRSAVSDEYQNKPTK